MIKRLVIIAGLILPFCASCTKTEPTLRHRVYDENMSRDIQKLSGLDFYHYDIQRLTDKGPCFAIPTNRQIFEFEFSEMTLPNGGHIQIPYKELTPKELEEKRREGLYASEGW